MRGSRKVRVFFRTLLCVTVLGSLGVVMVGTAGAATITSWIGGKASVPQVVTAADGNCPGTVIMFTGSGFVADGGPVSVTVGGTPSPQVIVGSDQYVYALVGPGTQSGPVVLTTSKGAVTAPGGNAIVFPCQANAAASTAPTVTSAAPTHVKAGKKVKLIGSGFVGTKSVTVNGDKAVYAIPSDGVMYVIVPAGTAAGAAEIAVTNNKGSGKTSVTVKS